LHIPVIMDSARLPRTLILHLGAVQFFAALGWIAYIVYLPRLAVSVGLPVAVVGWLLLADQLLFAVADVYLGRASDRALRATGRIGPLLVAVTLVSGAAFVAMPLVADASGASRADWMPAFLVLLVLWALTSTVLRAPALALVAKRAPKPSLPWLAVVVTIGNALAAAAAPYLARAAERHDPIWAFSLATLTLVGAVVGLAAAEKRGGLEVADPPKDAEKEREPTLPATVAVFFGAAGLLALGFQLHVHINAAMLYRQFVPASALPDLLPVFWIGVNLLAAFGAWRAQRAGALSTLTFAALAGAVFSAGAAAAPGLEWMVAAQLLAGGGWGVINAVLLAQALRLGKPGREGEMAGRLSALLAVATVFRFGITNLQLPAAPAFAAASPWLPAVLWLVAALLLRVARKQTQRPRE
jgi:hypothetical protein